MKSQTKISTCSYCLARVIISITPGSRHDLICNSCGARLEHTEFLQPPPAAEWPAATPPQKPADKTPEKPRSDAAAKPAVSPLFALLQNAGSEKSKTKSYSKSKKKEREKKKAKKEKKKKKRGLGYWIREAIDEIEDIFD